jgi:nucleoside-diphosphate-sugar epimerase
LKQQRPDSSSLKESDAIPAFPDSRYGWEKLFSEFLYKSYLEDYGLEVRIARYHNIYGPQGTFQGGREKAPAAICRKVAEAREGGVLTLWGDGQQSRSFLYIDDCLEGTYRLMQSSYSDPVNIGSDVAITVDELAGIVMKIAGKNLRIEHDLTKPQGVRGRNADLTLARKILRWEPKVGYQEGMAQLYEWVEAQVRSTA